MANGKGEVTFNYDNCLACGICIQACPVSVLELNNTDIDTYRKAYPVLLGVCIGCGKCEKACPFEAVVVC